MDKMVKDVAEQFLVNADENLLEGNAAVHNFVKDTVDELNKHKKQTTAAVAIAATLAAGGVGAAEIDSDVLNSYTTMRPPVPVVLDISEPPTVDLDDEDDKKDAVEAEIQAEAGNYIGQTIAKVILAPIYLIGSALLWAVKGIASVVAAPVLSFVLKWAIMAAVVLGALAIAFKTAFPDIPLGKLLNRKCVSFILVGLAAGSAVAEVVSLFWPQAGAWIEVIRIILGFVVMLPVFVTIMKVFGKRKKRAVSEA